MAKKRNLEGIFDKNLSSSLSIDNLNCLSKEMGLIVEQESFDSFIILKDLEVARNDLHQKQKKTTNQIVHTWSLKGCWKMSLLYKLN